MTTWNRHRTSNDSFVVQLIGAAPLTGVTQVLAKLRFCGDPAINVSLTGTITDSASAIVTFPLASWLPTAQLGTWMLTFHPEYNTGARPIWPEQGTDTFIVEA